MTIRILSAAALAAGLICAGAAQAADAPAAGDAAKGKVTFGQQCMLCHSVVAGQGGAGPSLAGVVGRKAGTGPGFPAYTKALKSSAVVWTPATLDQFLSGPAKMIPGTSMPISVTQPEMRKNIVAYLATLKK